MKRYIVLTLTWLGKYRESSLKILRATVILHQVAQVSIDSLHMIARRNLKMRVSMNSRTDENL